MPLAAVGDGAHFADAIDRREVLSRCSIRPNAAKHGLAGLTKTVALEAAEKGITVNAICPGYVWTPLVAAQVADQARVHQMSEDQVVREVMLAPQPTRQFVQPEEIAEMAAYLCGDMARSITGTTISIDGGWTAK